jgi:hypothetical protein
MVMDDGLTASSSSAARPQLYGLLKRSDESDRAPAGPQGDPARPDNPSPGKFNIVSVDKIKPP